MHLCPWSHNLIATIRWFEESFRGYSWQGSKVFLPSPSCNQFSCKILECTARPVLALCWLGNPMNLWEKLDFVEDIQLLFSIQHSAFASSKASALFCFNNIAETRNHLIVTMQFIFFCDFILFQSVVVTLEWLVVNVFIYLLLMVNWTMKHSEKIMMINCIEVWGYCQLVIALVAIYC